MNLQNRKRNSLHEVETETRDDEATHALFSHQGKKCTKLSGSRMATNERSCEAWCGKIEKLVFPEKETKSSLNKTKRTLIKLCMAFLETFRFVLH